MIVIIIFRGVFMKRILFFLCSVFISAQLFSQDLMKERIRKIPDRKKSVFFSEGIFHNGGPKGKSSLKALRHSFTPKAGFERLVFDLESDSPPRIYGHIMGDRTKISIDFFDTKLLKSVGSFGKSHYVETVNFYPFSEADLTIEIILKKPISVDLFTLEKPARLVLDIKE